MSNETVNVETGSVVHAKQPHVFPEKIDLLKNAELGFKWNGAVPVVRFTRLMEDLVFENNDTQDGITLAVESEMHKTSEKLPWLKASVSGTVNMVCQRCLEPISVDIEAEMDLAVLTEPMFIERLTSDEDYILLGDADFVEPVTGEGKTLPKVNLLGLIEDEVLVNLPLAPKHEHCEHVDETYIVEEFIPIDEQEEVKENPFDVLAGLKSKH